jgi:hypothetical protein
LLLLLLLLLRKLSFNVSFCTVTFNNRSKMSLRQCVTTQRWINGHAV